MKQIIAGITGNIKEMPAMPGMHFDTVSRHLSDDVRMAGGIPIIVPVGTPDLTRAYIGIIDKLVLSGGQNVIPEFCGEEEEVDSDGYSLERDEFEFALVKGAIRQNKPIFAVRRGIQLLNVALGGTLSRKVDNHWQDGISRTSHKVEVLPNSRVSHLVRSGSWISSFHHQSVKDLAPNLITTAHDVRDGTIKACESKHGAPILGIQRHPKLLLEKSESHLLFDYLAKTL